MTRRLVLALPVLLFFGVAYTASAQYNQQTGYRGVENGHYLKPTALIIPGTFLLYGALTPVVSSIERLDNSIMAQVKKNYPHFHAHVDDYIMWAPSASLYVMDAFRIPTKHNFGEHLLLDAGSIIITGGIGYAMRKATRNIDVFTTKGTKFPSGHAANAFRSAEVFHQELKDNNELLSYSGYLVATTVGFLRIYNKTHLLSQVLAGAGLGILSTKLTYWVFYKIKDKRSNIY